MARNQSLHVLKRKIREMQAQVAKLEQADRPGMREVLALLKKHRLSLSDVRAALDADKPAAGQSRMKGRKVTVKYRNPKDPSQFWTGRGRMPLWMADLVKKGAKQENFLIKPPGSSTMRNALGDRQPEVSPSTTPATQRTASAYLRDKPSVTLEAPGGFDEEPVRT